jgi:hypothetical protein
MLRQLTENLGNVMPGVGMDSTAQLDSTTLVTPPERLLWLDGDTLVTQSFDPERVDLAGVRLPSWRASEGRTAEAVISVSSSAATLAYSGALPRGVAASPG